MKNWELELNKSGYTHLPKQNEDKLQLILSKLGNVINETDVIANSKSKSLVTSDKFLDFHTDNHLAKYIIWYCHKQANQGGYSMLCDAEKVYLKLTEVEKEQLSEIHVYEHKLYPENKNSNPIVREIDGKRKFYYSFWLAREKYHEFPVFKKWRDLIQTSEHIKLRLEKNDILIIDNHRILHGRTEIKGHRFLKRYWLNPNYINSKFIINAKSSNTYSN